ncbi:PIF1 helicase [Medicago truncatula]|uniref:PIF1 helicase n=1 Tax=Medicago truncatula TaxID=3880 RepID=G7J9F4_MEDTR|nr:PIF1 helicase [Medicago truncatula]
MLQIISLSPSDVKIPFKFQRRQFPLVVSFAMTVNKSQGQSLKNLYVAISKVTSKDRLKILMSDD